MSKTISFTDNDKKLIEEILSYQEKQEIKSFVAAVRQLCRKGLKQSVDVEIKFEKN